MPENVVYLKTPQEGLEYGLNVWRWCYRPLTPEALLAIDVDAILGARDPSCNEIHQTGHSGKGGYQPFIDRKRGFYGVYAMREPSPGPGDEYTPEELGLTTSVRLYVGLVVEALK